MSIWQIVQLTVLWFSNLIQTVQRSVKWFKSVIGKWLGKWWTDRFILLACGIFRWDSRFANYRFLFCKSLAYFHYYRSLFCKSSAYFLISILQIISIFRVASGPYTLYLLRWIIWSWRYLISTLSISTLRKDSLTRHSSIWYPIDGSITRVTRYPLRGKYILYNFI